MGIMFLPIDISCGLLYISLWFSLIINVSGSCNDETSNKPPQEPNNNIRRIEEDKPTIIYIMACCADQKIKSSCTPQTALSVRITPVQYNPGVEMLVDKCSLSYKRFNQNQKEMFVAKVCSIQNIHNLKKSELIEKIEGGTMTTRSNNFIRKKPKLMTPRNDCNGGCCNACVEKKIHQVAATPTSDLGLALIHDCSMGDNKPFIVDPSLLPKKNIEKNDMSSGDVYIFNICKADKHILRESVDIANFSRIKKRVPTYEPTKPPTVSATNATCLKFVNSKLYLMLNSLLILYPNPNRQTQVVDDLVQKGKNGHGWKMKGWKLRQRL